MGNFMSNAINFLPNKNTSLKTFKPLVLAFILIYHLFITLSEVYRTRAGANGIITQTNEK